MNILSLRNVVKQYHNHRAVDDVTFDVKGQSIFGLLGPNGAGKTSLIRIITTITAADAGEVFINGNKLNQMSSRDIGYLPEERGLYKKMKVGDQLMFLAQLKGLSKSEAKTKINYWFEKFEIQDWWNKKVDELSKGMQQKIQFVSTVMHDPKLLILDEPFSGLDPINTNLIKDEIYRLNKEGTSIIFSTHRMEQVEEICEDIVLMNQGKIILQGNVDQIKEDFKEHIYKINFDGKLPSHMSNDDFQVIEDHDDHLIVKANGSFSSNDLLKALMYEGIQINAFAEIKPTLNEIFIRKVGDSNE
jgi:ABC-2 type transport system ATP-binding protein